MPAIKKPKTKNCTFQDCPNEIVNSVGRGAGKKYCDEHRKLVANIQVKRGVAAQRAANKAASEVLSSDDLLRMYIVQKGKCAVTGIEFEIDKDPDRHAGPWSLSVDKVNPHLGYTVKNTRLVVWIYNLLKNDWDDNETKGHIKRLYDAIALKSEGNCT